MGSGHAEPPARDGDASLDAMRRAIPDIAAGRPVMVVDDADRENEGDLIFAASKLTPELMAFMIRLHLRGDLRLAARGRLDRLKFPLMIALN